MYCLLHQSTWEVGCWHASLLLCVQMLLSCCKLSVWSEVQTCMWPSWCHCHPLSLASVKSRLVLPFWHRLTRVVPEKGPLNGCVCVRACVPNVPDLMHCCWQKVKSQIYAEYKKLKSDSNYANDRRVCEYLHRKLSHIKHVVLQYDQAKLGHWRRMFTRMLVSVQQLICQIPFKSEFVPESWDQIFKTYWDDFKKNLGKWPNL